MLLHDLGALSGAGLPSCVPSGIFPGYASSHERMDQTRYGASMTLMQVVMLELVQLIHLGGVR
jgi:hypothetical protein